MYICTRREEITGRPSNHRILRIYFWIYILFLLQKQKELLEGKLNDWQGDLEQVDDILVVGIKL